jgi:hypothetical protein
MGIESPKSLYLDAAFEIKDALETIAEEVRA